MGHTTTIEDHGGEWRATCSCEQGSIYFAQKWQADDWCREHLHLMERLFVQNSTNPSLRQQYTYFRKRQDDPLTPERDRRLWRQLADELQHRLGPSTAPDETLF